MDSSSVNNGLIMSEPDKYVPISLSLRPDIQEDAEENEKRMREAQRKQREQGQQEFELERDM
jgi:hypothetical protein